MDVIVTVCDSAAAEECPVWPGHPVSVHWGLPDPARIGDEAARRAAFAQIYTRLEARVRALAALDIRALPADARRTTLTCIHTTAP